MKCPACEKQINSNIKFCNFCGANQVETKEEVKKQKIKGWIIWLVIFIPGFYLVQKAKDSYSDEIILPALFVMLIAVLLHQRYYMKRSWDSILWGSFKKK